MTDADTLKRLQRAAMDRRGEYEIALADVCIKALSNAAFYPASDRELMFRQKLADLIGEYIS